MALGASDSVAAVNAQANDNGDEAAEDVADAAVPKVVKVKRISPGREADNRPVPLICDFRPFTVDSLERIRLRIEEETKAKELAKELKANPPGADDGEALPPPVVTPLAAGAAGDKNAEDEKPQPNPLFEAGKPLLQRFGKFPPDLYGKPIEDVDEYYHNKYVSLATV